MAALHMLLFLSLTLPALQNNLKILGTPDGSTRPAPCGQTCVGVSRTFNSDSIWRESHRGKVYKEIDMAGCEFVTRPVVTLTVQGSVEGCPSFFVEKIERNHFYVYSVQDFRAREAEENRCVVYWSATGYNC